MLRAALTGAVSRSVALRAAAPVARPAAALGMFRNVVTSMGPDNNKQVKKNLRFLFC